MGVVTGGGGGAAAPLAAVVWDTATTQTVPHNLPLRIAWDGAVPVASQGSGLTRSTDKKSIIVASDGIYTVSVEIWLDGSTPADLGSLIYLQATTSTTWNGNASMFRVPAAASPAPYSGNFVVSVTSNEYVPAAGEFQGYVLALGAPGDVSLTYAGISITRDA